MTTTTKKTSPRQPRRTRQPEAVVAPTPAAPPKPTRRVSQIQLHFVLIDEYDALLTPPAQPFTNDASGTAIDKAITFLTELPAGLANAAEILAAHPSMDEIAAARAASHQPEDLADEPGITEETKDDLTA